MSTTPRPRTERLIAALERAVRRRGLTKVSVAEATGLHPNTLNGFAPSRSRGTARRPWNPNLTTLQALERFLLPPRR